MYHDSLIENSLDSYVYITDEQPCQHIIEENYKFWGICQRLALTNQDELKNIGFDKKNIERLKNLSIEDIKKLSFGTMLVFTLRDSEDSLIKNLTVEIDPIDIIHISEADGMLQCCYWYFKHMQTSIRENNKGIWSTVLTYGMSTNFLHYLYGANNAQIWFAVYRNDLAYKLRMSNDCIRRILNDDEKYSLNNAFIPYLTILKNSNIEPSCKFMMWHKVQNITKVDSSYATYSDSEKRQLVKCLSILGATTYISTTETGLTSKVVRGIENKLIKEEGKYPIFKKASSLPNVKFIDTKEKAYNSTLFMTIYRHIVRNYSEPQVNLDGTIDRDIYINSTVFLYPLVKAFKIYHFILNEIECRYRHHNNFKELKRFDFNQCYSLAKELKEQAAAFFKESKIGLEYYYCYEQDTTNDNPFSNDDPQDYFDLFDESTENNSDSIQNINLINNCINSIQKEHTKLEALN